MDNERYETVILHSSGPIPGIPGLSHGPGAFLVDLQERTIMPVSVEAPLQGIAIVGEPGPELIHIPKGAITTPLQGESAEDKQTPLATEEETD